MAEIIHQHNGTTDKHIGDSIMAVFGAPVQHADDAVQAVRAAVDMQKKAVEINKGLDSGYGFRLNIGIGISTGKVFSGILGSIRKREFTSIGMAVNMASRLQRLARAGEILICGSTRDKVFAEFADRRPSPGDRKGNRSADNRLSGQYPLKKITRCPIFLFRSSLLLYMCLWESWKALFSCLWMNSGSCVFSNYSGLKALRHKVFLSRFYIY